jgi:hypothetical protein
LRGIYIYFGVILSISVELQQWMGQDGCLGLTLVGCWKMARGKLACEDDLYTLLPDTRHLASAAAGGTWEVRLPKFPSHDLCTQDIGGQTDVNPSSMGHRKKELFEYGKCDESTQ